MNTNIAVLGKLRTHSKASEVYVDVEFYYPEYNFKWVGSVPVEYRRTGLELKTEDEIQAYLEIVYIAMNPKKELNWLDEQTLFWDTRKAEVTKAFFNELKDCTWKSVELDLPKNPNWARRIQDLKELGYTIATNTNYQGKGTHLILLRLPRGGGGKYETWTSQERNKILKVLKNIDVYENNSRQHLLPDHKFPEIRWDSKTPQSNNNLSEFEIIQKFQLLNNQRNQQKREACRFCFQTNKRGTLYGINFFYQGSAEWDCKIPKVGKEAEKGCIGCGWYDIMQWRNALNKFLEMQIELE